MGEVALLDASVHYLSVTRNKNVCFEQTFSKFPSEGVLRGDACLLKPTYRQASSRVKQKVEVNVRRACCPQSEAGTEQQSLACLQLLGVAVAAVAKVALGIDGEGSAVGRVLDGIELTSEAVA